MVGFAAALGVEAATGRDLAEQIGSSGEAWFVLAALLVTAASLVPMLKGVSRESKAGSLMSATAEMWNGWAAMLGLGWTATPSPLHHKEGSVRHLGRDGVLQRWLQDQATERRVGECDISEVGHGELARRRGKQGSLSPTVELKHPLARVLSEPSRRFTLMMALLGYLRMRSLMVMMGGGRGSRG